MKRPAVRFAVPCIGLALCLSVGACAPPEQQVPSEENGKLTLAILDASSKEPVPARVELLDEKGKGCVAPDAIPILVAWGRAGIRAKFEVTRTFANPQTRTDQFYSTGSSTLSLRPGPYVLTVSKGLEYQAVKRPLNISAGEELRSEVALSRWIDMPARGWYGADDHIHLPRSTPEANAGIHQWMAAEDIHVANLLQMGTSTRFDFAPQYAHGEEGRSGQGHHLLISGQENPRVHFLGHAIILGADSPIHYPEDYLNLKRFFEEGRRQGGLNGFAHFGRYGGSQFALSLLLPHKVLDFLEVLQFEKGEYDVWYKILNTGFRLTPTAGTDYPWGWSHPGRERFYTRVRGGFTVDKWIEAVRAGRTFVTNGPMLSFRINGQQMGETIQLDEPGKVDITARVLFDPKRDLVSELEIIENGVVVRTCPAGHPGTSQIRCLVQHDVRQSGWLAIRASGWKRGEPKGRESLAHSAPIYISIANLPPLARKEESRRMARAWTVLLDDLEEALSDENIERLADRQATGRVDLETIRQGRPGLLSDIAEARDYFREQSR